MAAPSYKEVPDHWKHPIGPYRKAPDERGGAWWLVNPFTTKEPWNTQQNFSIADEEVLPDGFVEVFGERPKSEAFHGDVRKFQEARNRYDQDLEYFKRAGEPEWFATTDKDEMAEVTFLAWGMGAPRYYEGRYGWMGRFSGSQIKDFEAPAWTCLFGAHQLIAGYQMRLISLGIVPSRRHPFVPPHIWPQSSDSTGQSSPADRTGEDS